MKRKCKLAVLMAMVMMMFVPLNTAAQTTFEVENLKYEIIEGISENCVKVVGRETDPLTTIEITIPATVTYAETAYQVTEIGTGAFSNKGYITKVTLPDNCKSIGESAFIGCHQLSEINLGDVETIGALAFSGCGNLSSVDLSSCTSIGAEAFSNCSNLQDTVTIPGSCTSIGDWAFYKCTNITGLVISKGCEAIGKNAFLECSKLVNVTFPESLKSIGEGAFFNCPQFTQINIPKNVETIGNVAFYTNGLIETITVHSEIPPAGDHPFNFWQPVQGTTLHFEGEALAKNYTTGEWGNIPPNYDASPHTQDGMTFTLPGNLPENPEENPEATLSDYSGTETTLEIPSQIRSHGYEFAVTAVNAQVLSGKTEIKMESEAPLRIEGEGFTGSNAVKVYYPLGARDAYEDSPWKDCSLRPYDFEASTEAHLATVIVGGEVVGSVIVKVGGEEKGTVSHGDENAHAYDVNGDIVISPAEGYEIASITVTNNDGQEAPWGPNGDDRVISNITSDITVRVTLTKMMLITVTPMSNGKIYVNDNDVSGTSFYVKNGTEITIQAVPDSDYGFSWLKINGVQQQGATVTVTADSDMTVEASFYYISPSVIIPSVFLYDDVCYEKRWDANYWEEVTVNNLDAYYYNKYYTGDLELPEEVAYYGSYYKVTAINERAFSGSRGLRSVVLPSTVNRIGRYAFEGCSGLEKLVVKSPSSVMRATTTEPSVPTVDDHAFDDICETAILYVPEGWKEAFKAAPEWCKFFTIKEQRTDGTVLAELAMTATYGGTLTAEGITSDNDTQIVKVAEGREVTVEVTTSEGYVLTGLSYDGEDVMGQLINGKLTLSDLNGEHSLTAEFSVGTGIDSVQGVIKNIFVKNGSIIVEGMPEGELISLFDVSGRLLRCEVSNGGSVEIPVATGSIYIVRIGKQVVKLAN